MGWPVATRTARTRQNRAATATRIQKVAGNRSRFSRARLRQTSVMTLVMDMTAASSRPKGASWSSPTLFGHQPHRAHHAAGERPDALHVLRLEAVAVFGDEVFVVGQ